MHMHVGYSGKVFMNGQYLGEVVDFQLKDSGKREDFSTGSRRDTREGKGRFDLISPRAERRRAKVLEAGAIKYGERNWEKGQPLSRYLDSALRHINCIKLGMKDEDHPAQAGWNMDAFIHTAELIEEGKLPRELDDIGYCTFPDEDQAEESDVAGSPTTNSYSVENPCGSPGCVICYPKKRDDACSDPPCDMDGVCEKHSQREAGLPATSSRELSPLAKRILAYVTGRGGEAPIAEVFKYYTQEGFIAGEVYAAKKQLGLVVVRRRSDGLICWRLPEGK